MVSQIASGAVPSGIGLSRRGVRAWRPVSGLLVLVSVGVTIALHVAYPDALVTLLPSTDMRELHVDFDTFWHSAVALTQGADIYHTPAKLTNLNPPLLTVLLVPLAALDALTAYRIFAALTLLMVVGAMLAAARELRLRPAVTVAAMLAVLAASPLHGTLVLGQIYPMLLVGLVAGWIAQRRGRPVLGAVLFGVTVALKPSLAPLLLLPAVQRHWAPFRAGIAAAAGATLLGVLVAGPSSGLEWLRIAAVEPVPETVDNASLPGLFMRAGLPPTIGTLLGAAVLIGTLAWCARHRDRIHPTGTAPWAVLAAGLLFSPIAWHNYLMLLWPGVLVLITLGRGASAAVALAVAVIPVSWNADWLPDGPLAYSRGVLYFVVLFGYWVALVRATVVSASDESSADSSASPSSATAGSSAVTAGVSGS
jgi:hypothetical protein